MTRSRLMGLPMAALFLATAARADVVAHWTFDRVLGGAGMYPDAVNNGHPATPQNKDVVAVHTGAKAPFGAAVMFNGSPGSYLNIPAITNIQKSSFTVAAWTIVNNVGPNFILTDWPTAATGGFSFGMDPLRTQPPKANPIADMRGNEVNQGSTTKDRYPVIRLTTPRREIPQGEWHHLAWVWNRANDNQGTMKIYLDGAEIATQNQQRTPVNVAINQRIMRIGSREDPRNANIAFNGSMDELWVFNEALNGEQLGNLIKHNDIKGAPTPVARVETPAPPTPATPAANVTPTTPAVQTPAPAAPETPAPAVAARTPEPDVAPSSLPPPITPRVDVNPLGATPVRSNSGRTAGVLMCLVWAISLSTYVAWGLKERARLKAAGKL